MKAQKINIMLILLGVIIIFLEFNHFMFDGILGWLLTSLGAILIVVGVFYKSNNPIGLLLEMIFGLL